MSEILHEDPANWALFLARNYMLERISWFGKQILMVSFQFGVLRNYPDVRILELVGINQSGVLSKFPDTILFLGWLFIIARYGKLLWEGRLLLLVCCLEMLMRIVIIFSLSILAQRLSRVMSCWDLDIAEVQGAGLSIRSGLWQICKDTI
jgi:hypothetical protein